MNLKASLEDIELEDRLSSITADLVEVEKNSAFLERLFSVDAGRWINIAPLCSGLNEIEGQLEEFRESFEKTLRVTWLDYPEAAYGKGYCIIVFFVEALHWSNVALYNKQLFLSKFVHST